MFVALAANTDVSHEPGSGMYVGGRGGEDGGEWSRGWVGRSQ